ERNHSSANYCDCVNTRILHTNHIVKLESFKTLHHKHTASDKARMWTRHNVSILMQLVQHLGNIKHVVGFDAKVKFFDNRLGKKFNQCGWVGKCADLDATNHEPFSLSKGFAMHRQFAETGDMRNLDWGKYK
ncbi:hypothetical protein JZU68_02730, partial [bacterium]|nr:hypothetical protein [bacterium]